MPLIRLIINESVHTVDMDPDTPLLWVLRDHLSLTGTKYACGMGLCGACTVHLEGEPVRSCQTKISAIGSKKVTTIEGLAGRHLVQKAWIEEEVPQCGYCQSGQIMEAVALLAQHPKPTPEQIEEAMSGIICRCGAYQRIHAAIQRASGGAL